MRDADDTSPITDRGRHENAKTPWDEPTWRNAALAWTTRELTARGLRESGTARRRVRLRPWSVLVRIPAVVSGASKALAEGLAFSHTAEVAAEVEAVPPVVSASSTELFCQVLDRTPTDPHAWEEPLRQCATMQRALVPHTKDLEQLGVPSARTTTLPQVFDETVEFIRSVTAITAAPLRHPAPDMDHMDPTTLHALRPRLLNWSAELADLGIPESLPRLRDAYLEPWTGNGRTTKELRRALTLAGRLGVIGRAVAWGRIFPGASDETRATGATESTKRLLQLAAAEPLF